MRSREIGCRYSRNYFADEFIKSYRGFMLLLQSHLEFQVVTPRTLASFHGEVLILPDARCLSTEELNHLNSYAASGKSLIATGQTGMYDETGAARSTSPFQKLVHYPNCPGKAYYAALQKQFNQGQWPSSIS